ncbi:MAG: hypothetical protein RMY62_013455 [Nostoc sp. ZfuVER08]|nr:hypothetical protein [Nostoc sp. ZfuVER08]
MPTNIQWTDLTDNIIYAKEGSWWCQKISPGYANCYSEKLNQNTFFGLFVEEGIAPIPDHAILNRLSQLFNTLLPCLLKNWGRVPTFINSDFKPVTQREKREQNFHNIYRFENLLFLYINKNKFPSTVINSWGIQN